MYFTHNYKSKAAAKRDLAAGIPVRVMSNSMYESSPENGKVTIEGPWYPEPHKFYGSAEIENGKVVKIT